MEQSKVATHSVVVRVLLVLALVSFIGLLAILFVPVNADGYDCGGGALTNKWEDYAIHDDAAWLPCKNAQDSATPWAGFALGLAILLLVVSAVVQHSYTNRSRAVASSPISPAPSTPAQAAGWYPNPTGHGQLFWDGTQWFNPSKPPGDAGY